MPAGTMAGEPWWDRLQSLPLTPAEKGTAFVHIKKDDDMKALLADQNTDLETCESAVREILRIGTETTTRVHLFLLWVVNCVETVGA
jgi:hypothetical protein